MGRLFCTGIFSCRFGVIYYLSPFQVLPQASNHYSSNSSFSCFGQGDLYNYCEQPGHYARNCPNVACNHCGLPGHIAAECTTNSVRYNCREPGHMASSCTNKRICHICGNAGYLARDCVGYKLPTGDLRPCNNRYKQGHLPADCTNDMACNNCRRTGHLARDCKNEPICNLRNLSGHMGRQCPKASILRKRGGAAPKVLLGTWAASAPRPAFSGRGVVQLLMVIVIRMWSAGRSSAA